jgi:hypothetical protein
MKIGLNAKLYRNTGSFGSPTWVEVTNIQDLDLADSMDEADASTRGSGGMAESEPTLRTIEASWNMKNNADTHMIAFRTAYATRALVDLQILDGPIATVGSHGIRGRFKFHEFGKPQPLRDGQFVNLRAKPAADDTNGPPTEVTIAT